MHCSKCGKLLVDGASFCDGCGSPIGNNVESGGKKVPNIFGALAALIIAVSVFLPYVSIKFLGTKFALFQDGERDGVLFLILAIIALVFALCRVNLGLLFLGIICSGLAIFEGMNLSRSLGSDYDFTSLLVNKEVGYYLLFLGSFALLVVGIKYTFDILKEFFRKKMVALKRKPQVIALIFLMVTFLLYSLKLRLVSDTTARINMKGMGLAGFATMLFSILSFVCFLNAFPHRKKVNIPMLIIFFVMQGVILYCDFFYRGRINAAILREINENGAASAQKMLANNSFILSARNMLRTHQIFVIVTIALVVLLPLYAKLLRMVKTSINVVGNDNMGTIELNQED